MSLHGAGLGLRRDLAQALLDHDGLSPSFVELAPENWMNLGGHWGRILQAVSERFPLTSHGLSLSLGSPEPLDRDFLARIKEFLKKYSVRIYTEHLSFSKCDNAHLYDLLPIPFRRDAVKHVASRIKQVQDFLEQKIAVEIVSYYSPIAPEMDEATFVRSVVEEADCDLLLDINNVYVNSFNHGYDAKDFLRQLPLERVAYIHMAGHTQVSPELIIDSHGEAIIDPVYDLFACTLPQIRPVPVLLERDFNIPEFKEIQGELGRLNTLISSAWEMRHAA